MEEPNEYEEERNEEDEESETSSKRDGSEVDLTSDEEEKKGLRVIDQIGERMKGYEANSSSKLDPNLPFLARIDGHKFSNFTRGFKRPFDQRIHNATSKTTEDLVVQFGAYLGYTQSDEITLLFPECKEKQSLIFDGKIQKLASLMASYASVRFTYHMLQSQWDPSESKIKEKVESFQAHFDGRVFNVPNRAEALNNLMWRSSFDCRRNSVFSLALSLYPAQQLLKLGTTALVEKMKKEKNVDWEEQVPAFKYGSFVKKELYEKEGEDYKTKEKRTFTRTKVVTKSFKLDGHNEKNLNMLFSKYW